MKKKLCYTGAVFLPVLVLLILMIFQGISPFGSKTFMTIDLSNQYVSFFSYLKEIAGDPGALFYSFSKTLGGEMIGLTAYYLMSPLNLLYILVPTEQIPHILTVITLIKTGLAGLSFFLYLRKKEPKHLIFSTAFALMAYLTIYMSNTMWIDSIILLPLVLLGIEYIIENRKPWLYLGSLFFAILFNYYIGYMICLFSAIYFCYYLFFVQGFQKQKFLAIRNYIFSSLLAGGLTAILLVPVFQSLAGVKEANKLTNLSMSSNFSVTAFLSKFVIGSMNWDEITHGLPNMYCGIIILLFTMIYFNSKKYPLRSKAGALTVLLVLFFSLKLSGLNLIWHGLTAPAWFPYRNSFLFSTFLLILAVQGLDALPEESFKKIVLTAGGGLLCYLAVLQLISNRHFEYLTMPKIIIACILAVLAFLVLLFFYKHPRFGLPAIILLLLADLGINGWYNMQILHYQELKPFQEFVTQTQPAVDYVRDLDHGFYRTEKTFNRRECDPMLLRYKGTSHYSSSEKANVRDFMGTLGFRNNTNWSYYNTGTTYANDSFLGIKYILTKGQLGSSYESLKEFGDINIYRNRYTLPIGFMVSDKAMTGQLSGLTWYDIQNHLWQYLTDNQSELVFKQIKDITVKTAEVQAEMQGNDSTIYHRNGKKATVKYRFTACSNDPVFAYFRSDDLQKVTISVNGEKLGKYFTPSDYQILRLGQFAEGEQVQIKLSLKEDYVKIDEAMIFYQDMDVFENYYNELAAAPFEVDSYSNRYIKGHINVSKDKRYCLFTIPFDAGWQVYTDGSRTETIQVFNTLMAIEIPEGRHQITLKFTPPGLWYGVVISAVSLMLLVIWILLSKHHRLLSE